MNVNKALAALAIKGIKKGKKYAKKQIKKHSKPGSKIRESIGNKARDIIAGSNKVSLDSDKRKWYNDSLFPSPNTVGRPVIRKATKAIYLKNISRFAVTIDATYLNALWVINPWSINNTVYYGTMNTTTSANTLTQSNIQNSTVYADQSTFKSYRVIGAKVTIVNKTAVTAQQGELIVGIFDTNSTISTTTVPITVSNVMQCERQKTVSLPNNEEFYIPCQQTTRDADPTTVINAAYTGDLMALFFFGSATSNTLEIILEQDLELEPTPGTLYSQIAVPTEVSKLSMLESLERKTDELASHVVFINDDSLAYSIAGGSGAKGSSSIMGGKRRNLKV
jgi:hypothetical protein